MHTSSRRPGAPVPSNSVPFCSRITPQFSPISYADRVRSYPNSEKILQHNKRYIPGGVVSVNRSVSPQIAFVKARGALLWDADGNEFIDYHAAFAPYILGHNDLDVTAAVEEVMRSGASLYGAGTTALEGEVAELICTNLPWIESLQIVNTGSEATAQAIRCARGVTGRDGIIIMQGGYNGWHNDVAGNLMTPLATLGPRISPGEYPFHPISAGIPKAHQQLVHSVNYNDLDSVRWVCERYPMAALITEPVLQNIGIVPPLSGYLEGLRALADEYGFVLIFDEVKTGFRHAFGGYSEVSGVRPDLAVYGKAVANGFPMAIVGGKRELMDAFVHPDPIRRVLLAGTYNAHPVPTAATIATLRRLLADNGAVYRHGEALGARMEQGLIDVTRRLGIQATVSRIGSAFCLYFMDHVPVDWHDLATHHDFTLDDRFRKELIERGIYFFPLPVKQASISAAHTEEQIDRTIETAAAALEAALLVEAR
ncbi:MAG: aspartate aminotransferase family protein [Acidobacteria bacterium]|nr:aspartate aminotransferase family protein [Acidobacteriota bacterium]